MGCDRSRTGGPLLVLVVVSVVALVAAWTLAGDFGALGQSQACNQRGSSLALSHWQADCVLLFLFVLVLSCITCGTGKPSVRVKRAV